MPLPANNSGPLPEPSLIAGSVLPIQRAEELLATLPGVISARIVASISGSVEEIHILTTTDVTPKQTVRNVESALIAHLGMHVSHKKISVATSDGGEGGRQSRTTAGALQLPASPSLGAHGGSSVPSSNALVMPITAPGVHRRLYFEDVEVRRSRSKGITCRVTLRKGEQTYHGEAEGLESERQRFELAARAALSAIRQAEGEECALALEGYKVVDAFEREFVLVGVTARQGREQTLTTGSAEVRDSPETASVLAVLDATNRWLDR
ncbi:MAG: hypothetical protein ACREPM_13975 [Gemmatimonadaceae bacterium]